MSLGIASFQKGCSYLVTWTRSTSGPCRLSTGVSQGSVLSDSSVLPLYPLSRCGHVPAWPFMLLCWCHSTHPLLSSLRCSCFRLNCSISFRHLIMDGSSAAEIKCQRDERCVPISCNHVILWSPWATFSSHYLTLLTTLIWTNNYPLILDSKDPAILIHRDHSGASVVPCHLETGLQQLSAGRSASAHHPLLIFDLYHLFSASPSSPTPSQCYTSSSGFRLLSALDLKPYRLPTKPWSHNPSKTRKVCIITFPWMSE